MNIKTEVVKGYPEHLRDFIDQRYKTFRLAPSFIANSVPLESLTTLLIYEQDRLSDALLYVISGSTCELLNTLVDIPHSIQEFFCHYIFLNYKNVKKISIVWQIEKTKFNYAITYPNQVDVYIKLPKTKVEYDAMLGKKMRTQMGYYYRKIQKDYSNIIFRYNVPCASLSMDDWMRIVELKENRQGTKNMHNTFNEDKVHHQIGIYNEIGNMSMVTHDEKIIGALLSYTIKDITYAIMIAFDINYHKYSVARVLFYQTIVNSIERHNTEFHLLWRNAEYMDHYGGENLNLHTVSVFRGYGFSYICEFIKVKYLFFYRWVKTSRVGVLMKPWVRRLIG